MLRILAHFGGLITHGKVVSFLLDAKMVRWKSAVGRSVQEVRFFFTKHEWVVVGRWLAVCVSVLGMILKILSPRGEIVSCVSAFLRLPNKHWAGGRGYGILLEAPCSTCM